MLTTARTSTRATAPAVFDATTLPALPMDSDRVLVIRAASGDDRAFAAIVNRYSRLLRAIASRTLGSSADVDDVVQETFLAAWTHLDSVIDGETIPGWRQRPADAASTASARPRPRAGPSWTRNCRRPSKTTPRPRAGAPLSRRTRNGYSSGCRPCSVAAGNCGNCTSSATTRSLSTSTPPRPPCGACSPAHDC
ncbi:hypothetical protein GSU72_19840 (plasmid) [Rathayibacter sp. VKM Ac-2760]|nr:hypothetical protein GSU72_19840 [Rathayibacter sp. VKM Ac-2760]